MYILGIESSCDDTCAAVVKDGRELLSNCVASSAAEQNLYGGVVPEIASRRHAEAIVGVVQEALDQARLTLGEVDAVAVTHALAGFIHGLGYQVLENHRDMTRA